MCGVCWPSAGGGGRFQNHLRAVRLFKVADPQHIAIWLSGYYNEKRNNMVVDVAQLKLNAEKVMRYCEANFKGTVVEAVEKLFGPDR